MHKIFHVLSLLGVLLPLSAAHSAEPKDPEPIGNPGAWVTPNDYPPRALREEREGVTSFELTIGPDGKVLECEVTIPSGYEDLDAMTCMALTERAEFDPATDADGHATAGSWTSSVRWQIPENSGPWPVPPEGWVEITMIVEKDGTVSECSAGQSDGTDGADASGWCTLGMAFQPVLDEEGNPVRKRIIMRHQVLYKDAAD